MSDSSRDLESARCYGQTDGQNETNMHFKIFDAEDRKSSKFQTDTYCLHHTLIVFQAEYRLSSKRWENR